MPSVNYQNAFADFGGAVSDLFAGFGYQEKGRWQRI
jgi:hypothetical protein